MRRERRPRRGRFRGGRERNALKASKAREACGSAGLWNVEKQFEKKQGGVLNADKPTWRTATGEGGNESEGYKWFNGENMDPMGPKLC